MNDLFMNLKILLPYKVFAEITDVRRIVIETPQGLFGFWPRRLDCVAELVPGIFSYERKNNEEKHIAVDEGILVKAGPNVFVSVRNAFGEAVLGSLRETILNEYAKREKREKKLRSELAILEAGLAIKLRNLRRE